MHDLWWPPGMSDREFQFLRGIHAAIELTRESGYDCDRMLGDKLLMRYPKVKAIRSDGVMSAIREATVKMHHFVDQGTPMVSYCAFSPGRPSPSNSVWMVPTR